ncbi:MAG: hypothetical protein KDN22_10865 [Verrucomicrobiae bacterium]|nr:hypothetical protein [Verrucomicrobiae bacterium]
MAILVTSNLRAEVIADSITEFSGVQGQDDWRYGYRNYTLDGEENDYDPVADFIEFAPSDWRGTEWDLEPAASGPWTNMAAESGHPNGGGNHDSSTNQEHWTIRRWVATSADVPGFTPLAVTWHIREVNLAGDGVTGGIHHNGVQVDAVALEGGDDIGVERTYYINALPGDFIDLIMTPEGASGDRGDGSDGSANWMRIDTDIPANPEQPDGTPFEPASDSDTDADGLPDSWEEVYFPDDLTKLSSSGDYDEDGLLDGEELALSSNPTVTDTDGDTLLDGVENGTGVFVDASNAGTSPTKQDTDGDGLTDPDEINGDPATDPNKTDTDDDGFSDPAEILAGTNPTDAADSPVTFVIADSIAQFSGVQGQDGWHYGYRNYTLDEKGNDYDPAADFIAFTGGSDNTDEWDGIDQQWSGTQWDLETAAAGPWTALGAEGAHPNGTNSDPGEEHWVIRRWISDVTETTPVSLWWAVRKTNASGGGVSGSLNIDGRQIDAATIAGSDTVGAEHRYWFNLAPGEVIDLALTPEGTADRGDGSDGSAFWLRVDAKEFPDPRYQPNGDLFIPADAEDSDGDGLPDFWERIYFPDDLTKLASGQDFDGDGLNDEGELALLDSDPTKKDTDGDGLEDLAETRTGVFASAGNAGSHPRNPDTDGDSFSDGVEAAGGWDPNDPLDNPLIADSVRDFTVDGVQGENDWFAGYRNLTLDLDGADPLDDPELNYDPVENFIPFDEGEWTGTQWDLGADAPWTEISATGGHPNGTNNVDEHWAIRRWVANSIAKTTPLAITWTLAASNVAGGAGTEGRLYQNGQFRDAETVGGTDAVGIKRTVYLCVEPGDMIDLALTPVGPTGDRADGADGSLFGFNVSGSIPPGAEQPDGTPFVCSSTTFSITDIQIESTGVTLTWTSAAGKTYKVMASTDLQNWSEKDDGVASGGDETSYTDEGVDLITTPVLYYQIIEE